MQKKVNNKKCYKLVATRKIKIPDWCKLQENGVYFYEKLCKKCGKIMSFTIWTDNINSFKKEVKKQVICSQCNKKK